MSNRKSNQLSCWQPSAANTHWLVAKIRYDSSKFAKAEIEFRGADNETKIVVTRIRGCERLSESDQSLQL